MQEIKTAPITLRPATRRSVILLARQSAVAETFLYGVVILAGLAAIGIHAAEALHFPDRLVTFADSLTRFVATLS